MKSSLNFCLALSFALISSAPAADEEQVPLNAARHARATPPARTQPRPVAQAQAVRAPVRGGNSTNPRVYSSNPGVNSTNPRVYSSTPRNTFNPGAVPPSEGSRSRGNNGGRRWTQPTVVAPPSTGNGTGNAVQPPADISPADPGQPRAWTGGRGGSGRNDWGPRGGGNSGGASDWQNRRGGGGTAANGDGEDQDWRNRRGGDNWSGGSAENNNWRGRRFSGNWSGSDGRWRNHQHHDWRNRHHRHRDWWRSHYNRFALFGGGYYYWTSGYWYPAYGYDPYYSTYTYEAPLYAYGDLAPGDVIAQVQQELQRRGYYEGEIDGEYGEVTRRALLNFQRDNGLPVSGEIDESTLSALGFE